MDEHRPLESFDEQAALAELETLQAEIAVMRKRRQAASEAFDRFLRAFGEGRTESGRPPGRGAAARVRTLDPAAPALPAAVVPARTDEPVPASAVPPPVLPLLAVAQRRRWPLALAAGLALLLLAGVVSVSLVGGPQTGEPPAAGQTQLNVLRETTPGPDLPAAPNGPVSGDAGPAGEEASRDRTELVTLRRVWLRVTVNGRRALERELEGGVRIPIAEAGTIVVRAGDGGAVRLYVRGQDRGILGGDGQVVTRTFENQ